MPWKYSLLNLLFSCLGQSQTNFNHKANCHGQLTGKNKDNLLILIKYFDKQQYEQNNLDVPSYISVFSIWESLRVLHKTCIKIVARNIYTYLFFLFPGIYPSNLISVRQHKRLSLLIEFSNSIYIKFYFKAF